MSAWNKEACLSQVAVESNRRKERNYFLLTNRTESSNKDLGE
jgi:hypothetical protein